MEQKGRRRLSVPDVAEEDWCDFRQDYETGLSLVTIAEKYYCDSRTVRNAIIHNKSSKDIGKRVKPRIIDSYDVQIHDMFQRCNQDYNSLYALSRVITEEIQKEGFSGSERTVRNYLKSQPYVSPYLKEESND